MRRQTTLFLHEDTLEHIERCKRAAQERKRRPVSTSEIVEWLVRKHWKASQVKRLEKPRRVA